MKTLLYWLSLPLVLLIFSCQSSDENITPVQIMGKWKLIQVSYTSMIAGQPDSTISPPYEEILELRADSTFRRYRSTGYEATGTFSLRQYGRDEVGILANFTDKTLSYHDLPDYRQFSYTEGQVYFRQVELDILVESYMASDGPSFYYQKIKDQE